MKSKSTIWIVVLVVLACIVGFNGCSTYNSLMEQEEGVKNAWAKVEVQYQRRFDLIPNLVATVKGYAQHESETLQGVTNARAGIAPSNQADKSAVENATAQLSDAYQKAKGLENSDMSTEQQFKNYTGPKTTSIRL